MYNFYLKIGQHGEITQLEEKKLEVAQTKAKAKAEENEAFARRIEAGNGTPLEEKQLKLKIMAEDIRQHKAELALEKAREKAERKATAPRPPAQVSDKDLRREIGKGHRADYLLSHPSSLGGGWEETEPWIGCVWLQIISTASDRS